MSQVNFVKDYREGHLDRCQLCDSEKLITVMDLGHQPPCDSLLTPAQLNQEEKTYPLRFVRCEDCGLVQIDYVVPQEVLFFPDYPYRSGITATLVKNLQAIAQRFADRVGLKQDALVVDIGSNDGTLLQGFKAIGRRVLGVEPTKIAQIAIANGIDTENDFFNEQTASRVQAKYGSASLITGANVFAHVSNLGSLIRGVGILLEDNGFFLTESHYLLDILETVQYDSIYHEHLRFYSLKPMVQMMDKCGFTLVDVERIPNYGGSIRVYAQKGRGHAVRDSVKELLAEEDRKRIHEPAAYEEFKRRTLQSRLDLSALLLDIKRKGQRVVGVGCPGRSSTLLHYCGIDTELLPYIAEQSTSLKLGLFTPGTHIPVVDEERMFREQPEYALMLSWHYWEPIVASLRKKGLKSKIIVPLPDVRVIED